MRWIMILAVAAAMAGPASAQGPDGTGLRFDGFDDWVDFGAGPDGRAPFTLEAWVKPTLASTQPQLIAGPFGADRGGCYAGAGFRLQPGSDTIPGRFAFAVGLRGCGNDDLIEGPVPALDEWYHLAGTYDGSTMRFYVDGVLAGELKNIDYTPFPRLVVGCTYNERIGGPEFHFGGEIDELRLWDHVRTEDEIDGGRMEVLQGGEQGLRAYWNFDEGAGQAAGELVGGVYNGRLGDDADPQGDDADPEWVVTGEPKTPEEAIEELLRAVEAQDLKPGLERLLTAELRVALRVLRDGRAANDRAAVLALKAFVRSVSHRAGGAIPGEAADDWMDTALDVIEQLEDRTGRAGRAKAPRRRHGRHA